VVLVASQQQQQPTNKQEKQQQQHICSVCYYNLFYLKNERNQREKNNLNFQLFTELVQVGIIIIIN
jgi:hypothetical protein